MKTHEYPEITLLGTRLTLCSETRLIEAIEDYVRKRGKALILSGNVHSFNLAYKNPWLREYFNRADIVRLDGAGLRMGAFLLGYRTPPRITWADFARNLAAFCESREIRLYFLGNRPGTAKKAAETLQQEFPALSIAGTCHGYFEKTDGHPENEKVIQEINAAAPDILIVGMGMPLQEKWLKENRHNITAPVVMTAGAAFEWIAGEKKRAPRGICRMGLEWLWRLWLEPARLAKRYLIGNPLFLWRVLKEKFADKDGRLRMYEEKIL